MINNTSPDDPIFSQEVDELIRTLEEDGLEWSIQNSGPPTNRIQLAFVFNEPPGVAGVAAALRLVAHFKADADLRESMTDFALSQDFAFHEFGSAGTTWCVEPIGPVI